MRGTRVLKRARIPRITITTFGYLRMNSSVICVIGAAEASLSSVHANRADGAQSASTDSPVSQRLTVPLANFFNKIKVRYPGVNQNVPLADPQSLKADFLDSMLKITLNEAYHHKIIQASDSYTVHQRSISASISCATS